MTITQTPRSTNGVSIDSPEKERPFILSILHTALRHIRLLIAIPFGVTVLAIVAVYFLRGYTATATFLPNSSLSASSLSRLTGLAGELGFNLPSGGDIGNSPAFYNDLITSRAILNQVALHQYRFLKSPGSTDTVAGTGLQLLKADGDTRDDSLIDAYKSLLDMVKVTMDLDAGTVTVATNSRWAKFSEAIDSIILDRVNAFNLETRQTQARQERSFVEQRVAEAQKELNGAEDDLEEFQTANRTYQNSPRLVVEAARLQRRIDVRQQVYLNLVQDYESSRIDEVRDTPVITIVDSPEGSSQPPIRLALIGVISLIGGLGLAVAVVFLQELVKKESSQDQTYVPEIRSMAFELLKPLRRLRRRPR